MSRPIQYVFCRYSFTVSDEPLSLEEQIRTLRRVRGRYVSHRRSDGVLDTFVMRPKQMTVDGYGVLAWDVAQQVATRTDVRYDREADELNARMLDVDYVKYASFVAVPSLGVAAVSDRVSDNHIGASSGISRFRTVFKGNVRNGEAEFILAASKADARRALEEWSLSKFSFTVRPFNPHPSDPGRALSAMFDRDGIGRVQGTAIPKPGALMKMEDGGYIEETLGLVEAGYGQFGVQGTTPEGREATLKKPQFSDDKRRNEQFQSAPQQLRVAIEAQESERDEWKEAASALIEFYGE